MNDLALDGLHLSEPLAVMCHQAGQSLLKSHQRPSNIALIQSNIVAVQHVSLWRCMDVPIGNRAATEN